jgi:hypothetical protein
MNDFIYSSETDQQDDEVFSFLTDYQDDEKVSEEVTQELKQYANFPTQGEVK